MKKITHWAITTAIVLGVAVSGVSVYGEEEDHDRGHDVALTAVPAAAKDAAVKAVPGITLTRAEMEKNDAETFYEFKGTADGKEYEVKVTADGKVLKAGEDQEKGKKDDAEKHEHKHKEKHDMALTDVPAAVRDAVTKAVPGITLTEAEVETKGAETVYELEGKMAEKEYEFKVSPEGKILKTEEETPGFFTRIIHSIF